MEFNLCGPSYQNPSIEINNQRCVNLFPTSPGQDGRGKINLLPTAGLSLLINLGIGSIRSLQTVGDYVYAVCGTNIYQLTVNYLTKTATSSLIGTMTSSQGTVAVASNPTQVMWVDGTTKGYIFTVASGVFEEITSVDADFTGGGKVVFIDSYFVVNDPGTGQFYFSAGNDGRTWDPLDVATAESGTDNIVALGVVKGELWLLGAETTEIWYNAANPTGSPFSARTGLEIQIGCGAADSVAKINDLLIWLDNRGFIVQSAVSPFIRSNNSGYDLNVISTDVLTAEFLSYSRRDDAIAMSFNDRGHLKYQITFPTAKKTWVYDYTTKLWHERTFYNSYAEEHEHHLAQFYTQFASLHLMAGTRDGKIYLSSDDYYTDDGAPIYRIRTTPIFYDNQGFRLVGIDKVEIRFGILNSTVIDPHVILRYSNDGGHSWSHHLIRSLGAVGEYAKVVDWNRLGTAREWIFEVTIVENMPFSIIDGIILNSELEG